MPRTTICKQFTFHACHRLPNHDGACNRWHGHSYKLEIFVEGEIKRVNPNNPQPDEGMVLDFGKIKQAYEVLIEPLVEHQNLNETLEEFVSVTTAELMANWMVAELSNMLPGLTKVRLWDTPTSYAEVKA